MDFDNLKNTWNNRYNVAFEQLEKVKDINLVATAFNTNIDAIYKISGRELEKFIHDNNFGLDDIEDISLSCFRSPKDVILGIVKCFCKGIAEEWIAEDKVVYDWLNDNIGYQRLQMGGQAGIIANALALLGIKKVVAHTNSHPKLQAEQFLDLDNLYCFNDNGNLLKAKELERKNDIPLIHWIIEFDKGDSFCIEGKTFTCPKSNRFIATYDPLNMNLVMNKNFVSFMEEGNKIQYLLLSGFNPLLEKNNGTLLIKNTRELLKKWKKANPEMIIHLEIASTQDKSVRKAIAEELSCLSHSIGLNERETIDLLEVLGQEELACKVEKETNSANLFDALMFLKKKLKTERIQLHLFGLYVTILDKNSKFTPLQNLNGMITASVVSSSKAYNGELTKAEHLTLASNIGVSDVGLRELKTLAEKLNKPELLENGICEYEEFFICANPTILVDNPKTLVGMGDTISSVSLLAGR